jgi:hypothetical protein
MLPLTEDIRSASEREPEDGIARFAQADTACAANEIGR